MSDSAEAAPAAAVAVAAGGKTSKIVLALLALNLGATGFGVFTLMTRPAEGAPKEVIVERDKSLEVQGPVITLDKFVVNLDEPGNARYIKVTLDIELTNPAAEEVIEKSKQVIRDQILSHLSGLKLADTLGPAAKEKLRTALMEKIEAVVGTGKVRRMFFSEFMVQ